MYKIGSDIKTTSKYEGIYELLSGDCGGGKGPSSIPLAGDLNLDLDSSTKNTAIFRQDFGGVGNIYSFHPDGHGALRFYGNETVDGEKRGSERESKTRSW